MATRSVKAYDGGNTQRSQNWGHGSTVLWLGLQNYAQSEPLIERKYNLVPWVWFSFNFIFIFSHAQDSLVVYNEELGVYCNQGAKKMKQIKRSPSLLYLLCFPFIFPQESVRKTPEKVLRIKPLLAKLKCISFLRIRDVLGHAFSSAGNTRQDT